MRYQAHQVSNVEEFLQHGVGANGAEAWELHSVVPGKMRPHETVPDLMLVVSWLVILQTKELPIDPLAHEQMK